MAICPSSGAGSERHDEEGQELKRHVQHRRDGQVRLDVIGGRLDGGTFFGISRRMCCKAYPSVLRSTRSWTFSYPAMRQARMIA